MAIDLMTNSYILITFALFAYTYHESHTKADNYFSAGLIYLDSPLTNFILYNVAFSLAIVIYKFIVFVFFSEVKENQTLKILDKLKGKIFHVVIFLYICKAQISLGTFVCVVIIFLMFIVHNLAIFRGDYLIHTPTSTMSLNLNLRLFAFLLILGFIDYEIVKGNIQLLFSSNQMNVMFIYYMLNTSLLILWPMVNYFVDFYEKYTLSHINNSDEHLALVGLLINVPRLVVQVSLVVWICYKIGFSLLLFIDVFEHISELSQTIKGYLRIKRLTDTMKNLKSIGEAEISQHHDNTCMVCFQEMTEATLLPCKHFFHDECLRQWIVKNSNHFCPRCKKEFNFQNKKNDEDSQDHQNQEANQINDRRNAIRVRQEMETRRQTFQDHLARARQNRERQGHNEKGDATVNNQAQSQTKMKRETENVPKLNNQQEPFVQEEKIRQKQPKIQQKMKRMPSQNKGEAQYEEPINTSRGQGIWVSMPAMLPIDTPQEIVNQKQHKPLRAGSLPFGMPTQAVYHRTFKHIYVRDKYEKANRRLIEDFSRRQYEQMMLMAPF